MRVRTSELCSQPSSWTWATSAHCAVQPASLQTSQSAGRSVPVPSLNCFLFPPSAPTSHLPSLPKVTHFTKVPNERTSHLLCVFLFPSPPSCILSLCNFHSLCLDFPRSQTIVTVLLLPLEAAGLTRRKEAQKGGTETCSHSYQHRKGVWGGTKKNKTLKNLIQIVEEKTGREES